jgi:hypothetical protein
LDYPLFIVAKNKFLSSLFGLFIVSTVVSTAPFAFAIDLDNQSNPENVQPTDINQTTENQTDLSNKNRQKINLIIRIVVPHNKGAADWCRIYPYPVAPPKKKADPSKIPLTDKGLRSTVLSVRYWAKSQQDKPYPAGGWRMQYALKAAIAKSGCNEPHTIFTEYGWADEIIPYVRKEAQIINAKEDARIQHYNLAKSIYDENRADLEVLAFNQGLFPIDVPIRRQFGGYAKGQTLVDKTNWWVVATHQIPGLKYFWLWPIKLNDNPEQVVILNEDNAIYIEGAW